MLKNKIFITITLLMSTSFLYAEGNFTRIKNWDDGEVLTASDLNAEIDNIINNCDPSGVGDYSSNTTQMRSTSDPYPGSSESMPTDLAGEIERLRYQILKLNQAFQPSVNYWYERPLTSGYFSLELGSNLNTGMSMKTTSSEKFWTTISSQTGSMYIGGIGTTQPSTSTYPIEISTTGVVNISNLTFTVGSSGTQSKLIFDGDSLTVGADAYIPYSNNINTTVSFSSSNVAVSGSKLSDLITRAKTSVDTLYRSGAPNNVVVVWGGTNDIAVGGDSAQTTHDRLVTYCNARKQKGFKVIVLTMISRTGYDYKKNEFNRLIRDNWPTYADGLADVATSTPIGNDGAYADTNYFSDGTHLTTTGYDIVSVIVSSAINHLTNDGFNHYKYLAVNSVSPYETVTIQSVSTKTITTSGGYTIPWGITDVRQANDSAFSGFFGMKSRLSTTSTQTIVPAAVTNGDGGAALVPFFYDGQNWILPGYAGFKVDSSTSSGNVPTAFVVATGQNGSGNETLRIRSDGVYTFPYQSAVHAYRNSAATISSSLLEIPLNSEVFDTQSEFNTSESSYTAKVTGVYYICGQVMVDSATDGATLTASINRNGGSILAGKNTAGSTGGMSASACGVYQLTAGDVVTLYGSISAGTPSLTTGGDATYLSIAKIH